MDVNGDPLPNPRVMGNILENAQSFANCLKYGSGVNNFLHVMQGQETAHDVTSRKVVTIDGELLIFIEKSLFKPFV